MNMEQNTIAKDDFLKNVLIILRETFEGSPENQPSAYLDRGIGIFPMLDVLSAAQVSTEINGSSIVAHTEHCKFYLDRLCEFIKGRTEPVNWEQSWLIDEVNDEEWTHLRDSVRKCYENVLRHFAEIEVWDEDKIGSATTMLTHTAYHFGAIRQMAKTV